MTTQTLATTFDPHAVEAELTRFWDDNKLYRPEVHQDSPTRFSMVMPPPNVTGTLHMGHALDNTLQDILTRWHRMLGDAALWLPGTDHAGIATQNVVERQLREQGTNRHEVGREAFLDTVWQWARARQGDIYQQLRRLGISPDWDRARFTLDTGVSQAVREAFVRLYEKGLIYQGTYIVNWCPRCVSAISDIETDYVEEESHLWEITYPLVEEPGALIVATTRPETMFGDVAVAVHPEDPRYQHLIGKHVMLPLAQRTIPIIASTAVEREFGTGALKITPAHDPNDFQIALQAGLEPVWVIDEHGNLKNDPTIPEPLRGLERFEARRQTEALLSEHVALFRKQPHSHRVGHCQRCGTTVEPLLSKQWFVKTQPLAEKCLASLEAGDIRFIPERWTKDYVRWMTDIQDWCISRQLWWGHRIPAWSCADCGGMTVATTDPTQCSHCHSTHLTQETDVLDTWFSSGLWPFSTLGWPDLDSADLKRFYPTDVLVTGFDIIFFWVARMTMMAHAFTDQSPFKTVYIHGLIRDEKGQKMSKSKGNTVDPVEVINDIGCDGFRFALTSMVTYGGQDIKLSPDKLEVGKTFANKLWNASRFVLMNLDGVDDQPIDPTALTPMDRWILGRFDRAATEANALLTAFKFGETADVLYEFTWNAFCDWYVEVSKAQLRDPALKANTQRVLRYVLEGTLRLLHPIMPFITEALWQKLPHRQGLSIVPGPYPQGQPVDADLLARMDFVLDVVRAIRNIRQQLGIAFQQPLTVFLDTESATERAALLEGEPVIRRFVTLESLTVGPAPAAQAASNVVGQTKISIPLAGLLDVDVERERLSKKLETMMKELAQIQGLLGNPGFVAKAPEAVVAKNQARATELTDQMALLNEQLAALG